MFMKPVGTTVTLQTKASNEVLTYGAVLERIPGGVIRRWTPDELEGAGATDILGAAHGHNLGILPLLATAASPGKIDTEIAFSDGERRTETVDVTNNESFGWRIFMTKGTK